MRKEILLTPILFLVVLSGCIGGGAQQTQPPAIEPTKPLETTSAPTPTAPTTSVQTIMPSAGIPIIDAHSQVPLGVDLKKIVQLMDQAGVARAILAVREGGNPEELLSFASRFPERITPAVRTKGEIYSRNEEKYYTRLKKDVGTGQYGGMAEVLMYHAQKGDKAPEVVVYPDDERVQVALNYALENKWPLVVHIEFASTGSTRDEFMTKLEVLLRKHPEHPFVMIHMGQLEQNEARRLIESHPNIYFITSHSNPITLSTSNQPWINMFEGNRLSARWKQLMIEHSDRFILGFDAVWAEDWGQFYLDTVALWQEAMKELPVEVAHALAHGNAERLWHLPPVQ